MEGFCDGCWVKPKRREDKAFYKLSLVIVREGGRSSNRRTQGVALLSRNHRCSAYWMPRIRGA